MNGFLLDTNVLSEFSLLRRIDAVVEQWVNDKVTTTLFTSVLTFGEIQKGIEKLDKGKRRTNLENWFDDSLRPLFADRVLPVTEDIALSWARISVALQKKGITIAAVDGLIAATALEHDLTMVTRNVSDFRDTGVTLINPWDAPLH